jgi:hypothetical protein
MPPDGRRKLPYRLLVCPSQQNARRAGHFRLDARRNDFDDRVRVAELHAELAPSILAVLERSAVPYADHIDRRLVPGVHALDGVVDEGPSEPPHGPLWLGLGVADGDGEGSWLLLDGRLERHKLGQGDLEGAFGSFDRTEASRRNGLAT